MPYKKRRRQVARFLSQKPKKKRKSTSIKSSTRKSTIAKTINNEIWGLSYIGLGIIFILSINESFGIVGSLALKVISPILGWGIYILPIILISVGILFFAARKIHFGLDKTFGIAFMLFSILGVLHLYVPQDLLYESAKAGSHGGYIGFVSNFILRDMLEIGHLGTGVMFLITFLISTLVTFNISVMSALSVFKEGFTVNKKEVRIQKNPKPKIKKSTEEEEHEIKFDENEQVIQIRRSHISTPELSPRKQPKPKQQTTIPMSKKEETDYSAWEFPDLDLLDSGKAAIQINDKQLKKNAEIIRSKLAQFGINVIMHEVHVGPTVIQYTLKPNEGVKLSKIVGLKNDLALALAAESIRIEAPIPGKSLVGIELPNEHRTTVHLRELIESTEYQKLNSRLKLPLGRDVSGRPIIVDLASMPHLLIAGATGSGKSVGTNSFLLSLLYQNSPEHLKLIMIDPKRVELAAYNNIPHLLTPVITDPEKASTALKWAVNEMNQRYQLCADAKHRNIIDYNADKKIEKKMSNIVIIIDELADLMMSSGKDVENSICRIAQMARAVGIHLVIATQRPSVNVLTGLIKANIPARIAYAVSSAIDSRTIIDGGGAEDLLGKGDMLYLGSGTAKLTRVQGIYVSPKEIEKVTNRIKITGAPDYDDNILSNNQSSFGDNGSSGEQEDELYNPALEVIRKHRKASASLLQRRLKVGYARAARLLDLLEEDGKIGPVNGAKPREIYVE